MSNIDLSKAMEIVWKTKKCDGGHSISSPDYLIHKSPNKKPPDTYTVSARRPVRMLGIADTADDAKELCEKHKERLK